MEKKTISRGELKSLMDALQFFTLVDVRDRETYFEEHIPGAITLPLDDIEQKAKSLFFRDEKIIVYAEQGSEAASKAQQLLISMGFPNVFDYEEGMKGWKEAGMPTETGVGEQTRKMGGDTE